MFKNFFIIGLLFFLIIGAGCKSFQDIDQNIVPSSIEQKENPLNLSGSYESANASIEIHQIDNTHITIEGTSFWENEKVTVNEGYIDGNIEIKNNKGIYSKDGCEIKLFFEKNILNA